MMQCTAGGILTTISLALNVAVLVPVTVVISIDLSLAERAWGPRTDGRDILLSIYFAILVGSAALLALPCPSDDLRAMKRGAVLGLLSVQIVYKLLTTVIVPSSVRNPVVASNLGITILHIVTSAMVWRELLRAPPSRASPSK